MKYILTQKEYDELLAKRDYQIAIGDKKLQELCTKIADTMPITRAWAKDEEARPWGCWMTQSVDAHGEWTDEWYCDECPVQTICPGEKHWSK